MFIIEVRTGTSPPVMCSFTPLQVALYIWDDGNGPTLTAVPELCSEEDDSPQTLQRCATTLSKELPACVSVCCAWRLKCA